MGLVDMEVMIAFVGEIEITGNLVWYWVDVFLYVGKKNKNYGVFFLFLKVGNSIWLFGRVKPLNSSFYYALHTKRILGVYSEEYDEIILLCMMLLQWDDIQEIQINSISKIIL